MKFMVHMLYMTHFFPHTNFRQIEFIFKYYSARVQKKSFFFLQVISRARVCDHCIFFLSCSKFMTCVMMHRHLWAKMQAENFLFHCIGSFKCGQVDRKQCDGNIPFIMVIRLQCACFGIVYKRMKIAIYIFFNGARTYRSHQASAAMAVKQPSRRQIQFIHHPHPQAKNITLNSFNMNNSHLCQLANRFVEISPIDKMDKQNNGNDGRSVTGDGAQCKWKCFYLFVIW